LAQRTAAWRCRAEVKNDRPFGQWKRQERRRKKEEGRRKKTDHQTYFLGTLPS
jgi:hypothetical protein